MSVSDFTPLITGGATAMVGLVGMIRGDNRLRAQLKADAAIAAALPEGPTRERLLAHIDERVTTLIEEETNKTRDLPMLIVSLAITPALAALTAVAVAHGTWWSYALAVPLAILTLIFVYGIWETGTKAERDAKGMRVDEAKKT